MPERAVAATGTARETGLDVSVNSRAVVAVQALVAPFAAAWLTYVALGVLVHSRALRVYDAGMLPESKFLGATAYALAPDALLTASRDSGLGGLVLAAYVLVVGLALASWCWGMRAARRVELGSPAVLIVLTALLGTCLLAFTGLFSDDVYLYHLYGRMIETYGANPIRLPPAAFAQDAHLHWVYWKDLPSAYGPIWLMLSSALSAAAGDGITSAVLVYRFAALCMHLATTAVLWVLLSRTAPRHATAGTLFYAWNPLVLFEVVVNAHNDVLVALFAVLLVLSVSRRAWKSAAVCAACAAMVKPFAVLLLPALVLRFFHVAEPRARLRTVLAGAAAGLAVVAVTSAPLWAGLQLLRNISTNPASHMYTNSMWELASEAGSAWLGPSTVAIQHPWLDLARYACFLGGTIWVLTRARSRRSVAAAGLGTWLVFCLTASWVWPWYFVPAIVLAAAGSRGRGAASAAALTVGGLLFWATWPVSESRPALYLWRSMVLFGPLLTIWAIRPAMALAVRAIGLGDITGTHATSAPIGARRTLAG